MSNGTSGFAGLPHSTLHQKRIGSLDEQASAFQTRTAEIPLVLVPRWPTFFHFFLNFLALTSISPTSAMSAVPAMAAMYGVLLFWTVADNAPTYNVPTSDNVMVNVNLGPDFNGARAFVYKLGPQRLDELLSSKVVNDLREEFAGDMLDSLRAVLNTYGVQVMNVKITDVELPSALQQRLERTTAYKTKIEEHEKAHENRLTVIKDNAEQEMTTLRQTNLRRLQELNAEIQRFEIEMREMEELARGKANVDETNARAEAEVRITRARGSEEAAKIDAQKEAEARVRRAEIDAEASKSRAEKEAEVAILKSQAALVSASNKAKGMVAEAEAEMKAVEGLAEKRRFELEWKRLEVKAAQNAKVMKLMASKGRKLISGEAGAKLMQELTPTSGTGFAG
eukprot:jgi/Undpi1/5901/HiC_scaffold_2.g01175.m1